MGTWGIGRFDNDDAADFMIDVLESSDLSLVRDWKAATCRWSARRWTTY